MAVARPTPDTNAFSPLRMGLEPLKLERWLAPRPADDHLLAARKDIIAAHRSEVIAALPGSNDALTELADLLRGRGVVATENAPTDKVLETIGTSIAEDICILTGRDGIYRLSAAVLCFPNRWRLADKMGRDVTAIHAPVPDYAAQAAGAVDRFLEKLRPLRAFVRDNWGLVASPTLYLPEPASAARISTEQSLYYRREEQSFLKLPLTQAIIFAIRTTVTPWADVPARRREAIIGAAQQLSADWLAYKALDID